MITQFIRRGGTKRRGGILVAFVNNNDPTIQIGFSRCNKKDRFETFLGTEMAVIRAERWSRVKTISTSILGIIDQREIDQLYNFINRANNYFKKHSLPSWALTFNAWYER
jgi:hypothetical protein